MKKYAIFILLLIFPFCLNAQSSMTDQQVFEYVVKQYDKGASQTEIVSELFKKGVDMKQLQRVRTKYAKDYKNLQAGGMSGSSSDDRLRVANGEPIIKETHWFRMTAHSQSLVPQTIEDITQAVWVPRTGVDEKMSSSYASLEWLWEEIR